jgi:hypothetical protein
MQSLIYFYKPFTLIYLYFEIYVAYANDYVNCMLYVYIKYVKGA